MFNERQKDLLYYQNQNVNFGNYEGTMTNLNSLLDKDEVPKLDPNIYSIEDKGTKMTIDDKLFEGLKKHYNF